MRRIARNINGDKIYNIKPFYRERMVRVVGAISLKKVIGIKTIVKSINEKKVLKFVQEELAQNLSNSPKTSRPCRNFIMPLTPLTALTYW
jgi:putative transposase